jgi:hypothetical protein
MVMSSEFTESIPAAQDYEPRQIQRGVVASAVGTLIGERSIGRSVKQQLTQELVSMIGDNSKYHDANNPTDLDKVNSKLLHFRPRMAGAILTYSQLTNKSYKEVVGQQGFDSFYLFWALGAIQDDFIDDIPKLLPGEMDLQSRKALIGKAIFGDDRRFYRAAYHQLHDHIDHSGFGEEQTDYVHGQVHDWYKFIVHQEAEVLETPFQAMDFEYCKDYRESQNAHAGKVLVAMLNGTNCLAPELQAVEPMVSKFSFLSQTMDDIADTAEDLTAERPSYAVGALIEHPDELARMQDFVAGKAKIKVSPGQFKQTAPESYDLLRETYSQYCKELRTLKGGRGIVSLARGGFYFFPHFRDFMYKVNPQLANF